MKIIPVLLELLECIKNQKYKEKIELIIAENIDSSAASMTENPRDNTEGNLFILHAIFLITFSAVQDVYGLGGDDNYLLCPHPIFIDQMRSQIAPLERDNNEIAIGLGLFVITWEQVFYEVCHEVVHLLDPVLNVRSAAVVVSLIEEGVAVKFAENMYSKFIKPHCNTVPYTSPINEKESQYFKAYAAVNKIPDDVLREVRSEFGKFSSVNDADRFKLFVGNFVDDSEIKLLTNPVNYSIN